MDESNENEHGNVGAVNAPSQNYNGKPYQKLCSDDLVGNWFATLEEANNFYYAYAHVVGFSVRKNIQRIGKHLKVSI